MQTQMRHPFRTWLESQDIAEPALALFNEGMVCYAAGAYRAALVFSYLGLLRAIAHRLMLASRPSGIPESLWSQYQRNVREDSTWEAAIVESLVMVKPASIFLIDDDLREQLQYWRRRRNDAAHARTNEIDAPHVESLWLFARSNLPKLIVAGGREGLQERFRRHFDPSYTPPGADFAHLVAEIPQAIRTLEYTDFLRDILRLTYDISDEPEVYPDMSDAGKLLIQHVLTLNDQRLTQALIDLLDSDQQLLVAAILRVPQLTTLYHGRGSFIRKLWHDLLPFKKHTYFDPINRSLGVLVFLLRNGMIPELQRDEAFRHIIGEIQEGYTHSQYTDEVMEALTPFGFWEAVKSYGFSRGDERWVALNLALAVEYLARFPVDREVALAFARLVPKETDLEDSYLRGSNFYEVEDCLDLRMGYFDKHPEKLDELVQVANENEIDISLFEQLMRPSRWVQPIQAPAET